MATKATKKKPAAKPAPKSLPPADAPAVAAQPECARVGKGKGVPAEGAQ
ncbi:hypothetical protein [Solimonas fluminis]|nr:hypothetical protein [Solimonas fluminis]